jgi:hypothetical protein
MVIYYDSERQLIHSVSKDGHYRVLDWSDKVLIIDEEPGIFELTYLLAV